MLSSYGPRIILVVELKQVIRHILDIMILLHIYSNLFKEILEE